MKRYILNILIFFIIVVVLDFGVGKMGDYLQSHAKSGNTKRINDLTMNVNHDIVILGSSRAHHHYDTPFLCDTLGLDVYNAGYDGNGVVLAVGILDMISQRYQPKLVLFDVEPAFDINVNEDDNNHVRYINVLKPYYKNPKIGNIISDVSLEEWYKVHSGMLRYNTTLLVMLKENIIESEDKNLGYVPLHGVYNREPLNIDDNLVVDEFKLKYVEMLIDIAHDKNIPIAFVASPKYTYETSEVLCPVKDICEKHGVELIDDYADEEFLKHKEWFKEPMHLNEKGAREFSKMIVSEIYELLKENDNQ